MDRRRLSACANFMGYTDAMGYINQPNVSMKEHGYDMIGCEKKFVFFFKFLWKNIIDLYLHVSKKK
jgi:hypothetical protein